MVIVSTRDFRANQSRFLDMVNRGESVILKSRSGNFRIMPVSEEDLVESKSMIEELRGALKEVRESLLNKREMKSAESLLNEL